MADVKQEFTKEEKEIFAERVYQLVDSLTVAINDMSKAGLRVELGVIPNPTNGEVRIETHVFENVCYSRKRGVPGNG